jgi:hypothetical protein
MTNTAFSAEDLSKAFAPLVAIMRPFMRNPERGADTAVYLAISPDVEGVTGRYFADRKLKRSNESSFDTTATAQCGRSAPTSSGSRATRAPPRPAPLAPTAIR